MKKAFLIVLTIGVCVALIVALKKQRNQLGELMAEQAQMLARLAPPVELPMSAETANDQGDSQVSHSPSMELLKLRAEVARMINRKRELANVYAEREHLKSQRNSSNTNVAGADPLPPDYIKKSEAKFVGYNSPEDTIQSLLWAMQNRDISALLNSYEPVFGKKT